MSRYGYINLRKVGGIGLNKRAIAWLANAAWKARQSLTGEYCAPYRWQYQNHYPYGLMVWPATRAEYKESCND